MFERQQIVTKIGEDIGTVRMVLIESFIELGKRHFIGGFHNLVQSPARIVPDLEVRGLNELQETVEPALGSTLRQSSYSICCYYASLVRLIDRRECPGLAMLRRWQELVACGQSQRDRTTTRAM